MNGADRLRRSQAVSTPRLSSRAELVDRGNRRVLVVDDQQEIHHDFEEMLRPEAAHASDHLAAAFLVQDAPRRGLLPEIELLHALTGQEGVDVVRRNREAGNPVAAAYVDIRMPSGMNGVETIRRMRAIDAEIELVIITAYADTPLPEIVGDMDLLDKLLYVRKPFAREEIQQMTRALIEKWNVERELAKKHRRLEAVLDATGDAVAMYDRGERVVFANRRYQDLIGATEGELRRMSPEEITAHFDAHLREPQLTGTERELLIADGDRVFETVLPDAASERRLFRRTHTAVRDEGTVVGDLYVYRDVSKAMETERMRAEVVRLRSELETTGSVAGMVGSSAPMKRVYALMERAADSDITVLVRGESGTGKELVAKSLHFNGARKDGPFEVVNCAAVPESLIESELFGHEPGAFTGATRRRIGTFERASGGTVLLDEIGDMQASLQAKLLRVLQEREIQRVGGAATIPVDVRVVAATNRDLEAAIRDGTFREDLYYRLAAFPIAVPPLRERREDIPLLARHVLRRHADRAGKAVLGISTAALRLLLEYAWPGNVRELENVIERAALLETADLLQAENLPRNVWPGEFDDGESPSVVPLEQLERRALRRALAIAGSVAEAAQALGIDRATMYRKLRRYHLGSAAAELPEEVATG